VPWRDITDRSDWVCDDDSLYFNTWQERDDPTLTDDWNRNDTEHLADYDETYTYACIIEYNTPPYVVPNRGCAIFLHVSDHPTEGCVGLLTEDMIRVLRWLDPHRNPHILISGYEK
jgi:L,D-peptidoglycan transpeptidase YkuD (ErfK/YbiS/YcfS/YnhG family)